MRIVAPALVLLVVAGSALTGCVTTTHDEGDLARQVFLLALDGRWNVPQDSLSTLLAQAGWPSAAGAAWFGGGVATLPGGPSSLDFVALDPAAARLADASGAWDPPAPGDIVLAADWARAHSLGVGDEVQLRVSAFPRPLVTSGFEMERLRSCGNLSGPVCFLTSDRNMTSIRVHVPRDAQDLAMVPEGNELGPNARPAWWNGSIEGPSGERLDYHAMLAPGGHLTVGDYAGPLAPGNWTVRFRLESARPAINGGLAGIVRLRQPGYAWFDDRIAADPDGASQTRGILANATDQTLRLHVARLAPKAVPGGEAILAPSDARTLLGARADEVGGLVVNASPSLLPALAHARTLTADAAAAVARARPFPQGPPLPLPAGDALLFRAPSHVDVASLPPVPGAGTPSLTAALEMPVGENASVDGRGVASLAVLSFGGPGEPPFRVPSQGRWTTTAVALDNLTVARTLVLSTPDWAPGAIQASRVVLGDPRVGRVTVAVESVLGGPAGVAWASASLVAGSGKSLGAVIVLPLEPGVDRMTVARAAAQAWAPFGLAPDQP